MKYNIENSSEYTLRRTRRDPSIGIKSEYGVPGCVEGGFGGSPCVHGSPPSRFLRPKLAVSELLATPDGLWISFAYSVIQPLLLVSHVPVSVPRM